MWDALRRPQRVLLLGGTSEIGVALLAALALPPDAEVVLAGRSPEALQSVAERLACPVTVRPFEALDFPGHEVLLEEVFAAGDVDLAILAFGILGDSARAMGDVGHALEILDVDLRAQASLLLGVTARMQRQGQGLVVVFSSVAAVRARRANFVYGAAKAGLDALASGLADALHGSGVRILLVRPGFVVGRMTAGLSPAPFSSTPEQVAAAVARAVRTGAQEVWAPRLLRPVAAALPFVPRPLWRRLPR